jgi:cell division protease FtsH
MVCYYRNRRDRIQVLTIVPRGPALGYLWSVEKEDYVQTNMHEYLVDIEVSLGGYAAENLHQETTTSGVSADLQNVGSVVRSMVRHWGMGSFKFNVDSAFGDWNNNRANFGASPETERQIELECKQIVDTCLTNVEDLLRARRSQLDKLAQALLEKETLYYEDIASILEPERSKAEIQKELDMLGERKLVGTPPTIDFENYGSLSGWSKSDGGNGSNGANTIQNSDEIA